LTAKGSKIIRAMESEYGSKRGKSVFYASRNAHKISGVDASPAPSGRLSYYASLLPGKEHQFQTPEGYRIYKDVPIARTGFQQYLGREIKKNPGYKPEWGIGDDELVTVYRPLEEVTAPETLASFEGKSVLDEHPSDPQILVDALDEYESTSKGHAQNIRVGSPMDDGETPLLADLHVKHPDLNVKVDDGVRDVSCGYTFELGKDADGRYVQRKIRGNHVAIVPKGRAGSEVGIKDSAPKSSLRRITMSNRLLVALGLQAALKDAEPEEAKKIVDAALESEKEEKAEKDADEHPKGCRCDDCAGGKDKKKGSKDGKGAKDAKIQQLRQLLDEFFSEEEEEPAHAAKDKKKGSKDADEFGDDEMTDAEDEEKKDEKAEKDAEGAIVLPPDEHAESDFSTGDAANLLKALRPAVAKSGNKGAKDAYLKLSESIKGGTDPFASLTRIVSSDGVNDSEPEPAMFTFFNGKPYAEGLKAYNEYQAARAARK
jgi:hypothetical protein